MMRKQQKSKVAVLISTIIVLFLLINWFSDNVLIGEILKVVLPSFYKWQQKGARVAWFQRLAEEKDVPLHVASGWNYVSEDQYNSKWLF